MREDEEDEDISTLRAVKFSWACPTMAVLAMVSGIADAVAECFSDIALGVASHIKYTADKDEFARDAGLEIERITEGQ